MNLLPAYIGDGDEIGGLEEEAKLPREYGIDFGTGQLTGGIVEGKEAIKVWIWLALQTPRYRYYIYTWDYGNEFEDLIGKGYTEEYIEAEALRMTEDCLLVNEDIQGITGFSVNMEGGALTISFTADTIFGGIGFKGEEIARPAAG
ncbi:DUF2634 domain-containing protein [Lachnospiraceae bacterium 29-84]